MTIPKEPNFLAELEAVHTDTLALLTASERQLEQRPAPEKWSALQCVDHVVRTNTTYIPLIRAGVESALANGRRAERPFRYRWWEQLVIWAVEPPSRLRVPTPSPAVDPAPELTLTAVRADYERMYADLRRALQDARPANLRQVWIESPFARRVGGNAGVVIGVLLAHERRHLYQARTALHGNTTQ